MVTHYVGQVGSLPKSGRAICACPEPPCPSLEHPFPTPLVSHHHDRLSEGAYSGHRHGTHFHGGRQPFHWREKQSDPDLAGRLGHRDHAAGRPYDPFQRHFAHGPHVANALDRQVATSGEGREGDRKVEARTILGHIARA